MICTLVLSACGLKKYLPGDPVLDPWSRSVEFRPKASGVAYIESAPVEGPPVLPLLVWGVTYDLDLVIVSKHPEWNMHEYALLRVPQGDLWLAKDAREGTLDQSIVADVPDIDELWPELPVQRKAGPVRVENRSTDRLIDLDLAYENPDGEAVELRYLGPPPHTLQPHRNGSTMGHSRNDLLAVLDLSHRDFAKTTTMRFDGERVPVKRLLGIVPFHMALQQTQGGLARGEFRLEATPDGFAQVLHMRSGKDVRLDWHWEGDDAVQSSEIRTLRYQFRATGDGGRELVGMTATQWGRATPTTNVALSPALPDLRRRFSGTHTSRFVIDVNGQQNHAVGRLEAFWTEEGPRVRLIPEEPWWTADRPMETTVRAVPGGWEVSIARVPDVER